MERLTTTQEATLKKCCLCIDELNCYSDICCGEIEKAIERLREYENLGLTPDQLKSIDDMYAEVCRELAHYQKLKEQGRLLELPMQKVFEKIIAEFDKRIGIQLKIMAGLADETYRYGFGKSLEAYQQGKMIVEQAAAEYNNGWIPVEERLPEEPESDIEDLDTFPEYIVIIAGAKKPTTLRYAGNGEWYDSWTQDFYGIIAWQPLPEPYQPKGE